MIIKTNENKTRKQTSELFAMSENNIVIADTIKFQLVESAISKTGTGITVKTGDMYNDQHYTVHIIRGVPTAYFWYEDSMHSTHIVSRALA